MQRQPTGGRTRALVFLVGSLLLALVAAALVYTVIRRSQQRLAEAAAPAATLDVVIARRDLYMGLPITLDDVEVRAVVPEMVPRETTFSSLDDVLGRTPRERILGNEAIRVERLARPDAGVGLNAIVTPGKRGMTIATDTETGIAGLLQAGNYIDVIVTIAPEDPLSVGAKWVTETILQGIKVLAVGSALSNDPAVRDGAEPKATAAKAGATTTKSASTSGTTASRDAARARIKPSITLEVTPEEAEKLALAMSRGEIRVVLRSDVDILQIDSHGLTTAAQLIGFGRPTSPEDPTPIKRRNEPPSAPALPRSEVIQGGNKSEVTFQPDGTSVESGVRRRNR